MAKSLASQVWRKLAAKVKEKGGTKNALNILNSNKGESIITLIAEMLVRAEPKIIQKFMVTVDYSQSLRDMISAGKYECVENRDKIVPQNFPVLPLKIRLNWRMIIKRC